MWKTEAENYNYFTGGYPPREDSKNSINKPFFSFIKHTTTPIVLRPTNIKYRFFSFSVDAINQVVYLCKFTER